MWMWKFPNYLHTLANGVLGSATQTIQKYTNTILYKNTTVRVISIADEVRFRLVQGVHQGGELDEVDRGDCLASASLLLLTLGLLFLGI